MKNLVKFAFFLIAAVAFGMASAQQIFEGKVGLFVQRSGSWITWPAAGSLQTDPYTRSHFLTRGKLPVSRFEAVEFEARADDTGKNLDADCIYTLKGRMPTARWWSLSSHVLTQRQDQSFEPEPVLSSMHAIYDEDDTISIKVARNPQPGNWLQLPESSDFRLILRLYNPVGTRDKGTYSGALFSINRETCR